jgi:glycosyltransferase involved in cell wall biosynthesis
VEKHLSKQSRNKELGYLFVKVIFFANTDWYLYNFRLSLIKHVHDQGHDVVLIAPEGEYSQHLRAMGFHFASLRMDRGSLNPLKEILVLLRLLRIYKQEKPDVVHHFTLKCVIYGMFAALLADVNKKINAITGLGYVFTATSVKARLLRPLVRMAMRLLFISPSSQVIVQNQDDYNLLLSNHLVRESSLFLIQGSGVNTRRFSPANRQTKTIGQKINVLMGTRLLEDKGVREYVQAAHSLIDKRNDVMFWLVGQTDVGNPSSISATELNDWKESGKLQVPGHVDNMEKMLETADIVVLPSYREGLPRILIEAASCGLPLITTDVPGCREVVDDGINGLLVPVKHVDELREAIEKLLDSPELRERMGRAAREKAIRFFDERIVIQKTIETYH